MMKRGIRLGMAGILAACSLLSGGPAAAADVDEQLRQLAREMAGKAAKGRIHRLAVEPFAGLDGTVTRLGRVLADEVTAGLAADPALHVMDQRPLAAYLDRQRVVLLSGLSRDKLARAGKELALDGIVAGSVTETASQIRVTLRLIAVKSGRLAATARTTLPRSGLLAELAALPAERSTPSRPPEPAPQAARSDREQKPQDPSTEGMALIQAGPFLYGEGGQQRTVTLPSFWMDLFEVTNARYAEFRVVEYDPLASHRPVANVSWNQAAQFCRFHGKRLPTEQEWEKAARGTDGRQYPWGNTYEPVLLNADNRFGETTSVGRFEEGRSPYGLYDMAGNVMEWTDSGDEQVKVFRGGSWVSPPPDVRATSRGSIAPAYRLPDLGFRCARDAR